MAGALRGLALEGTGERGLGADSCGPLRAAPPLHRLTLRCAALAAAQVMLKLNALQLAPLRPAAAPAGAAPGHKRGPSDVVVTASHFLPHPGLPFARGVPELAKAMGCEALRHQADQVRGAWVIRALRAMPPLKHALLGALSHPHPGRWAATCTCTGTATSMPT